MSAHHFEAAGGSNEHIGLKLVARNYLKRVHNIESRFEQAYMGYFPDVISIDNKIICECGQTNNPEKIFNYFTSDEHIKIIQIPYPDDTDNTIQGYIIEATPKLIPFLEYESKGRIQTIKDILNKR